ncbi:site-specific integrase [Pantoea sp. LMR881]|uniref:site-specific integrase n=1 Tax=Pantoea sp. LMR881 TaxID=3014336 RepID=UPI0022AE632B|nr:site-specific integrase [Pantoea sp. LMR881]MCZ4057844.1 site-specific integrase [Pantoea sp. LMR881]
MAKYPTGVENHGGFLRIWFIYKGKRVRESLGLPDTPKNRKAAGELRASVCYQVKTGNFSYPDQFPGSPNAGKYGVQRRLVTLAELANKWLSVKEMDLTANALRHYRSYIGSCLEVIGHEKMADSVTQEDILIARKEMLTGIQRPRGRNPAPTGRGRTVPTVNSYFACLKGMFSFAAANGYVQRNPMESFAPLRKSRPDPDPLTRDEYARVIAASPTEQMTNLIIFAVNTGMRHGEIISLAWEDIDTMDWTVKIVRGQSMTNYFNPPKTDSGIRTIQLTAPAIEALKSQMALTRIGQQHEVTIHLRQKETTRTDLCTFVFSPRITTRNGGTADWYTSGTINSAWRTILRKAGVRMRKSYETRHTFACWALAAGANPNFVAHQMGHSSAQMLYNVYGKWMTENNHDQVAILNADFSQNAPPMPHKKIS